MENKSFIKDSTKPQKQDIHAKHPCPSQDKIANPKYLAEYKKKVDSSWFSTFWLKALLWLILEL